SFGRWFDPNTLSSAARHERRRPSRLPPMDLAATLLQHVDAGRQWSDSLRATLPNGVDAAYALALQVRALRIARGERPAGYKVGFTNRTIWQRYQVFAPIWGSVWDSTLERSDGS